MPYWSAQIGFCLSRIGLTDVVAALGRVDLIDKASFAEGWFFPMFIVAVVLYI